MVYRLSKKEGFNIAVFIGIIALILVVAACSSEKQNSSQNTLITDVTSEEVPAETSVDTKAAETADTMEKAAASGSAENTKTFTLAAKNFRFLMDGAENPGLRVNLGDKVRIELNNTDGFHDWKLDELNAATEKVRAPASTSVTFVADKKGEFEYYCSVGSHREQGMKGKFIVE